MTQPMLAHQTAQGRMYSRAAGETPTVPSITTIIAQAANDLHGWHGHMAAQAVISDKRLANADRSMLYRIARDAAQTADRYRDDAAVRGDRVHMYCEQYSRKVLGLENDLEGALLELQKYKEQGFAQQFEQWFSMYQVEPIMTEATIWNHQLGYAGTLDLIARIGGRLCIIDFKTKTTDKAGQVKPLSSNVVMQLAAGAKAEEYYDEESNSWEPWPFAETPVLMALALANTNHIAVMAEPAALPAYWSKFCTLKRVWDVNKAVESFSAPLKPIQPPTEH